MLGNWANGYCSSSDKTSARISEGKKKIILTRASHIDCVKESIAARSFTLNPSC
jgi:hypothetical protein